MTGTEGSIPPATAFDEDQIEIVTVIQKTYELVNDPTLVPSHSDLTQLWRALQALFAQKYITTHISKTVHGVGADFTDLNAAFAWLAEYIITPSGFVTFYITPGQWAYDIPVEINHANAARVAIQGQGTAPTPNDLPITGYHSTTDGQNHIIKLRSLYQTELFFRASTSGFLIYRGGATLRYLLITGTQAIDTGYVVNPVQFGWGSGIECYDQVAIEGVSVWGFGLDGIFIHANGAVVSGSGLNNYCGFNKYVGIQTVGGYAYIGGGNATSTGAGVLILEANGQSGCIVFGAFFWTNQLYIAGNAGNVGGLAIENGGEVWCGNSTFYYNQGAGVYVQGSADYTGENSQYINNSTWGFFADGGNSYINNSYVAGNGAGGVAAGGGAYILASGSSIQSSSPPLNVVSGICMIAY